jgi:hypothetical protein
MTAHKDRHRMAVAVVHQTATTRPARYHQYSANQTQSSHWVTVMFYLPGFGTARKAKK